MSKPERLDQPAIDEALGKLSGWKQQNDAIVKTYSFRGYPESVAFVGRTVEPAETAGHHPDFDIRYNRVHALLTTHDAGGLSQKDVDMAAVLDRAAAAQ